MTRSFMLAFTVAAGLLVACGDDTSESGGAGGGHQHTGGGGMDGGGGAGGSTTQSFSIQFRADVGGTPFACSSSFTNLGSSGVEAQLTDFRMYVHDLELLDAEDNATPLALDQDGKWQLETLALLDFEDGKGACSNGTADTRAVVTGTAPAGDYIKLRFKLGVPAAQNHLDVGTAESPLNLSALYWTWTDGYKYLRADAMTMGTAPAPFLMHLGATGCSGDPALGDTVTCSHENLTQITLDGFDPAASVAVFDYADLVSASDLTVNAGGPPGCMAGTDDPECAPLFERLGLDLTSGQPMGTQSAFHVE